MGRHFRVASIIGFCYGHRLLEYEGKCAHLHGHNAQVEVILQAPELDERGMVADFSDLGGTLERWIGANLDHRMILRHDDPLVAVLEGVGEPIFRTDGNPTAEELARLLFRTARDLGLPVAEVRLWETPDSVASYVED